MTIGTQQTTVTLDADASVLAEALATQRGQTLEQVVDQAIRNEHRYDKVIREGGRVRTYTKPEKVDRTEQVALETVPADRPATKKTWVDNLGDAIFGKR